MPRNRWLSHPHSRNATSTQSNRVTTRIAKREILANRAVGRESRDSAIARGEERRRERAAQAPRVAARRDPDRVGHLSRPARDLAAERRDRAADRALHPATRGSIEPRREPPREV